VLTGAETAAAAVWVWHRRLKKVKCVAKAPALLLQCQDVHLLQVELSGELVAVPSELMALLPALLQLSPAKFSGGATRSDRQGMPHGLL
jgi:hypothetical protein